MKIAVIGGVAAGTSAAAKARRENRKAEIVLFEKNDEISYAGCGLPYYISGVIVDRKELIANTPEEFRQKYDVDLRINHEVTNVSPEEKVIKYNNLNRDSTGRYKYDKLIIATGAKPVAPPIPGSDLSNILTLRKVKDADRIKNLINKQNINKVVIVGGGLIGLEMAEAFKEQGLEVVVVEMQPQVLGNFSKEMAEIIEGYLEEKGVELILDDGVAEFTGDRQVEKVHTGKGKEIKTDLVLLSIGVKPNVKLAEKAGIELGSTSAIVVNEEMETSVSDIYAAGDCVESRDLITENPAWVPLGSTANKQGRVAGGNAAGGDYRHKGILKTGITKIFEMTAATTGLSEKEATEKNYEVESVKITTKDHASYFPGAKNLHIKGIFAKKTGDLLGAEIIGKAGVDKRIDVLSTAIYGGLTAKDLFQIDLAYAPPYSNSKDPVAILGMVAEKKL